MPPQISNVVKLVVGGFWPVSVSGGLQRSRGPSQNESELNDLSPRKVSGPLGVRYTLYICVVYDCVRTCMLAE